MHGEIEIKNVYMYGKKRFYALQICDSMNCIYYLDQFVYIVVGVSQCTATYKYIYTVRAPFLCIATLLQCVFIHFYTIIYIVGVHFIHCRNSLYAVVTKLIFIL